MIHKFGQHTKNVTHRQGEVVTHVMQIATENHNHTKQNYWVCSGASSYLSNVSSEPNSSAKDNW